MGEEANPDVKSPGFDRGGRESCGRLAWLGRELCTSFKELLSPPLLFNLFNMVWSIAAVLGRNPFMAWRPKEDDNCDDLGRVTDKLVSRQWQTTIVEKQRNRST